MPPLQGGERYLFSCKANVVNEWLTEWLTIIYNCYLFRSKQALIRGTHGFFRSRRPLSSGRTGPILASTLAIYFTIYTQTAKLALATHNHPRHATHATRRTPMANPEPTPIQERAANALIEMVIMCMHLGFTADNIQECVRHADRIWAEEPPLNLPPAPTHLAPRNRPT